MPDTKKCPRCKGKGYYEALVSQHDDKKETVKCTACNGGGVIHQMTDDEERDYHADYEPWS
jgi:DnaJ-class molecular chaperone